MGYSFTIGQRIVEPGGDGNDFVTAEVVEVAGAPLDPWGGRSNKRSPSYTAWADFSTRTGLGDLFPPRCDGGLIPSHPGRARLVPSHLARFVDAGHARPWLRQEDRDRLEWLVFWTRWAIANCAEPIFANQ